jgi:hypothetical protein
MSKRNTIFGLVFLSLAVALTASASSNDLAARSVWAAKALTIDGLASDWTEGPMVLHEGTKAEIAFRNDAGDLYILVVFKDPKFWSTLEKSGVTVYFNARGENKKDRGIKFIKLMLTSDQLIARRQGQGRKLTDEQIAAIKAKPIHTLFLYDIVNKKEHKMMAAAKPALLPDFNAVKSGNVWTFEIKIPLARNENQPFGVGVEPGSDVKIGIEWGGRTEPVTQQETQFSRSLSDRDVPGQDAQIRKGEPKYIFWMAVNLAPKS